MAVAKKHIEEQVPSLSIDQHNAIDMLILGSNDRETAEAVGVQRSTVTKWRLYNPEFKTELNRRRHEVWGSNLDKMRSLLGHSLAAVMDTLTDPTRADRWKVAMEVIKSVGFTSEQGVQFEPKGAVEGDMLMFEEIMDKKAFARKISRAGITQEDIFKHMADMQKRANRN